MTAEKLIDKYYPEDNFLKQLLLVHSRQVCAKALEVVDKHGEIPIDRQLLFDGAMLHDIGIYLTYAPGIHCYGPEPYLMHGSIGAQLMLKEDRSDIARICERHTGAGLTAADIVNQHLPLPVKDYLPETWEEKIICYADKFYSKSKIDCLISFDQAYDSLLKFGKEGAERFGEWHRLFG